MRNIILVAIVCLAVGILVGMNLRPTPALAQSSSTPYVRVGGIGGESPVPVKLQFDQGGTPLQLKLNVEGLSIPAQPARPLQSVVRLNDLDFVVQTYGEKPQVYHVDQLAGGKERLIVVPGP